MRRRALLLVAALVAAACTTGSDTPESTTSATAAQTTTSGPSVAEPVALRYGHEPGDTLVYDVGVTQDIAFSADGDAPSFGEDELPIDADLVTESNAQLDFVFTDGTQDGSVRMTITGVVGDTRVAGTVNGEAVDNLEEGGVEADLARIDPVEASYVLNDRGEILESPETGMGVVGAELAALTGLTDDLLSSPLGPVFPVDRPLAPGDTWASTAVRRSASGSVEARSTSEVLSVDGAIHEIVTVTVTEAYETDLAEGFRDLFLELEGLDPDGEVPPEVAALLDEVVFRISVAEATTTTTIRFDAEAGVVRSAVRSTGMALTMEFRFPAAEDGALSGYELDLDLTQSATYELRT